jgi:hypothetical protein
MHDGVHAAPFAFAEQPVESQQLFGFAEQLPKGHGTSNGDPPPSQRGFVPHVMHSASVAACGIAVMWQEEPPDEPLPVSTAEQDRYSAQFRLKLGSVPQESAAWRAVMQVVDSSAGAGPSDVPDESLPIDPQDEPPPVSSTVYDTIVHPAQHWLNLMSVPQAKPN